MNEKNQSKEVKQDVTPVKFQLDVKHTHKGEDYKKGDVITLRKNQADRLQKDGTGKVVNG